MEVIIKCKGSGFLPLNQIVPFQGNLKDLSDQNYNKLKNQILSHGMISPFMLWQGNCLDGHQRLKTLLKMKEEGISMPEDFPIVEIDAPDEKSAKKIILALSSQYGKMSEESLFEFSHDLLEFEELSDSFEFDKIDFDHFNKNFFKEEVPKEGKEIDLDELEKTTQECPSCGFKMAK